EGPPPRRGPYVCGLDAAMDVVSGKWKSLVLWELAAHGVRRYAELKRGLPGVSDKVLAQQLREMEADDLLVREVFPEVPPRVEYSLTEHGKALNTALERSEEHTSELQSRENLVCRLLLEKKKRNTSALHTKGSR